MREGYDFRKGLKNPYAKQLNKTVTLKLPEEVIGYFKALEEETGVPYQKLINLYLTDCARKEKRLSIYWN